MSCIFTSNPTRFQHYDDIIKIIHKTPRVTWNQSTNIDHALKYISWELNVSINIIAIRHIKCSTHSYRNIFVYKFQNTILKLLRKCEYPSVNILIHDHQLYVVNNLNIVPKLLNTPEQANIIFNNRTITPTILLQIINKTISIVFQFTINIYTSYTYLRENSKHISSNLIGQYVPDPINKENILHISLNDCI